MALTNLHAALTTLTEVLTMDFPDVMGDAFTRYLASFMKHVPLDTDSIGNAGRRYDFRAGPTDNTMASGRLTSASRFITPKSQPSYDSIVVKPAHINSIQTPLTVNYADLEYAQDRQAAHDIGFNKAMDAHQDMTEKRDILMWSDRLGKIGGVARDVAVSGDVTEDASADHLTWDLYLDETAIPAAFTIGRRLHICENAGAGVAVAGLRNYNTPVIVVGPITHDTSESGAYWKVKVRQSYLAADITNEGGGSSEGRTEVVAEVESVADGDIVCVWGGATASAATMPAHGPNYGYWGLRDMYARTNIETATGATSTALTTWEGGVSAGTTVSRADGANFGWLAPSIIPKSGAQITWADIDSLFVNLDLVTQGEPANWLLMNTIMLQSLANQAGVEAHRFNASATNEQEALFAKYGVRGVVYQSTVRGPVVLVGDNHVGSDQVLAPIPGALRRLAPSAAAFVPGSIAGIWTQRRHATGNELMPVYDAVLHESQQIFPNDTLRLCGAITGGKP